MNRLRKAVLLAIVSAAICAAQTPSTDPPKGSVAGTVTNTAGEPLKGATLRLQGAPQTPQSAAAARVSQAQAYGASSDAQGNFKFEDLEPGRYTLSSERAGYLRANYTVSPNGPIASLDLTSGQILTGIGIKMTPQAMISGRITDENGDPYPSIRVNLSRWTYVGGQKQLQAASAAVTNAEGAFSIGSLAAGSYYVVAIPPPGQEDAIQKGPQETYVTTYYPGATDSSGAIAVPVTAGGIARGTDIRLRKVRAYHVRGKLAPALAAGLTATTSLLLFPKDGLALGPIPSGTLRNGVFDFEHVLPGVYILQSQGGGVAAKGAVRQTITVGSADLDGLVLSVTPSVEITGTISTDGPPPPPPPQQQSGGRGAPRTVVVLAAERGERGNGRGPANDDGTFAIHNLSPAVYEVRVQPLPQGTYVKSIRLGSQDVTKAPLDLTGGGGGVLNIKLSPNAGNIAGIVHDADGMPVASVTVSLWTPGVPVEGATDFTRSASTDVNGQFTFASLPPGEYRVAAWEQIDPGLGTVPEFRIKFESKAAAVKLEENAHENIEAPLIGRDAIEAEAAKLQ